jgi:DHA2 family multidrug resistance protein-like MFS transporter
MIVGAVPAERAGAASAISETSTELGGALGIAILGSIGTAVYRSAMLGVAPAGVERDAIEAARSTLGGALEVAQRLTPQAGAELLGAAREVFTQSFITVTYTGAAIMIATAAAAIFLLRHVPVDVAPQQRSGLLPPS